MLEKGGNIFHAMSTYNVFKHLSVIGFALLLAMGFSACEDEFVDPVPDPAILKNFPVIDVHQHIYSTTNFPSRGDPFPYQTFATPAAHYDALVKRMKDNNVVLAIAGGPPEAIDYFYTNYPENHSIFWYSGEYTTIDESVLPARLSILKDAIREKKIKSLGELLGIYNGLALNDPFNMQLYAIADSFALPVFIHTGIVPDFVYENFPDYAFEASNPANLKPVLEQYPDVNFNAAHNGISIHRDYDFEDDVLELMYEYNNFYVDIAGTLIFWESKGEKETEKFLKRAIEKGVENKILYGSDEMIWPDAITASINYIKQADYLTDTIKKQILYWNAARYLKLSEEEIARHFWE
jgi:uncharacterized protein